MRIFESNYTQIPNELLNRISEFKPHEFCVLMFLCRKTFGWGKLDDRISLSKIEEETGLSRNTVLKSVYSLQEKGIIEIQTGSYINTYKMIVSKLSAPDKPSYNAPDEPIGNGAHDELSDSSPDEPRSVNSVRAMNTQKKGIKDTSTKENNIVPAGLSEPEQQQEQEEPKPKTDYQQIVDLYYKLFQDYCGRKPVIDSAFGAMVKDLLSKQTVTDIVAVMTAYFDIANRELWFMRGQQLNWKHFRAHYDAIPTGATAEESFVDKARRELNGGTK